MTRQDHKYVNLPTKLVEVVDTCVTGIFRNGTQIYANRKDFVVKSILQQIETEKTENHSLSKKLKQKIENLSGGNRPKNV